MPHLLKSITEQISDMQSKGIIQSSDSPRSSPVVVERRTQMVPKYRFWMGYCAHSAITQGYAYLLANIAETLDAFVVASIHYI